MSVQINQYLVYGTKLDYEKYGGEEWYDKFYPYYDNAFKGIHHHDGICVIDDGMNGEYIVVGRVLYKTGNYQFFEGAIPIDNLLTSMEKEFIETAAKSLLNTEEVKFGYFLIGHYK